MEMDKKKANNIGLFILWLISVYLGPINHHWIEEQPTFLGFVCLIASVGFVVGLILWIYENWANVFITIWNTSIETKNHIIHSRNQTTFPAQPINVEVLEHMWVVAYRHNDNEEWIFLPWARPTQAIAENRAGSLRDDGYQAVVLLAKILVDIDKLPKDRN